jgi:hypothetical protein
MDRSRAIQQSRYKETPDLLVCRIYALTRTVLDGLKASNGPGFYSRHAEGRGAWRFAAGQLTGAKEGCNKVVQPKYRKNENRAPVLLVGSW